MDDSGALCSTLANGAEIRPVTKEHFHFALDCLESAFPDVRRGFFHAISQNDPGYDADGCLGVWLNNRVVAYAHVFDRTLLFNGEAVRFGGIGSVGTHANHRGCGYAKALLQTAAESFCTRGMQGGMLFTGIHPFYEALGWKTIRQTEWQLTLDSLRSLCLRGIRHRPMKDSDLDGVLALHQETQVASHGTVLRSREYWERRGSWMDHPVTVVVNDSGSPCAYAYTTQYKTDVPTLHVTEMGVSAPEDVPRLFGMLVDKALAMRCTSIQGFFHALEPIREWIEASNIKPVSKPNEFIMWYDLPDYLSADTVQNAVDENRFLFWQTDAF